MSTITLDASQLACLASPARNEVFMQLRTAGKASIGELARAIGKKPEAVHYHVKALVSAGLAREAFRRPAIKKPEAVYEPIGTELRLPNPSGSSEIAGLIRKSVAAGFRQSIRGYLEAAKEAELDPVMRAHMHVVRMNVRLSPNGAKEFIRRLEDAIKFADEHRSEDGLKLVWSSIVFPASQS